MARRKNPHALISSKEASKAIYIDFEGFVDKPPTLIGILIEDHFEQIIFEDGLRSAADAKGMRVSSLNEVIDKLYSVCADEGRLIVAYSQHEINVIRKYTNRDISDIYRDARMIARRWKSICFDRSAPIRKCKALKDYLTYLEFPRGSYLGEKKSTARIKAVLEMSKRRGNYDALTPVVKAKWTKLLEHNQIDCIGMKALVETASRALESRV